MSDRERYSGKPARDRVGNPDYDLGDQPIADWERALFGLPSADEDRARRESPS